MIKPPPNLNYDHSFKNIKNHLDNNVNLKIAKRDSYLVLKFDRNIGNALFYQCIWLIITLLIIVLINWLFSNMFFTYSIIFTILYFLYQFVSFVKQDCLVVVKSLGYQITTKYVMGQKSLFIPWNRVRTVFINEVIIRDKVIPLLTILTKDDEEQLIPLFLEVRPYLQSLETIYKYITELRS